MEVDVLQEYSLAFEQGEFDKGDAFLRSLGRRIIVCLSPNTFMSFPPSLLYN